MFTKNVKNDPLVYSIKAVMEQNEHQRRVEALVNEHFGVQSKNNLPHELHSEYDAVFAQMMNEEKEDEGGMSGSATQHKQAAIKAHLSIKAGKKSPELMEKKKMHERMYKRLTGKDISYPSSVNEGMIPRTPRERDLAAKDKNHPKGDPNKITKRDVLIARGVPIDEDLNGEIELEEGIMKNIGRKIRKATGIQRNRLNKKAYDQWWSAKSPSQRSAAATRVRATQNPKTEKKNSNKEKYGIKDSWTPGYEESNYLKGMGKESKLEEKAPPGAKFERMVKHIKKSEEDKPEEVKKRIAYATAWKQYKKQKMDEQTSIDSVVEEIRNNLEEQLVYVYENYDESSFSEFVNSLSEEELSILELDSINEADGWQPPSKASVAVRDAASSAKRHSDSGRAERRNYTQDVKTLNRQGMEDNPMSPASSRSDLQRNATPQSGGAITQSSQGGSYKSKAQSSGGSTTTGAAAPGGSITQRSQGRSMAQSSGGSTTTGAAAPGGAIAANAGRGRMDVQGSAGPNATRVSKREGATGKDLATSGVSREMRRNQDYVTRTLGAGYKAGSKKANLALAAKAKQGPTASGGVMGAGAGGITQSSQRAPTKPIKESFESFLRNKFLKD